MTLLATVVLVPKLIGQCKGVVMPVQYELRSWGDLKGGPVYYSVDGLMVTKEEYYRCWKENQTGVDKR